MIKHSVLSFFVLLGFSISCVAQYNDLSREVGIIFGPVAFQSDYGQRNDLSTNAGNTGFGIGLVYYLNSSDKTSYQYLGQQTYFDEHFKLRSSISFSKTKLKHFGRWVDQDNGTLGFDQLQAMRGSVTLLNVGLQLEYFPLNIRGFNAAVGSFAPFVSIGGQYSYYKPSAYSLLGPLGSEQYTFPKYLTPSDGKPHGYTSDSGYVGSLTAGVGARYNLSPLTDLLVDLQFQYYFSDWVDGLNANSDLYKENKAKDSLVWFNVGYIYYLE